MGHYWDNVVNKITEWVQGYAKAKEKRPGEILRALWREVGKKEISRRSMGTGSKFFEAEILLVALCKLARDSQQKLKLTTQDISEIQQGALRIMWCQKKSTRSPQGRGLDESQPGKPGYPLHQVSSEREASQNFSAVPILRTKVSETWDVSEALSEMEKIWRSVFDESEKAGDIKRIRVDTDTIVASAGFPLSKRLPGRVGLLRGAGNSINPYIAAEFIKAAINY
jgi:hypothetical protein